MYLRQQGWVWVVTGLCVVLGMFLALALKTQNYLRNQSGIPTTRFSGLAQALLDEKASNKLLRDRIAELLADNTKLEQALGEGSNKSQILGGELQKAKFLAGLSAMEGTGVEIALRDSSKDPPDPVLIEEYIIHDADLRNFVNELLANGAEAISVSDEYTDQRIIATSSIRCVGATIQVNGVKMAAPFVVKAIGPSGLDNALKMPGGIVEQFRYIKDLAPEMVQIKRKDRVVVPAFSENVTFKYAKQSGGR